MIDATIPQGPPVMNAIISIVVAFGTVVKIITSQMLIIIDVANESQMILSRTNCACKPSKNTMLNALIQMMKRFN